MRTIILATAIRLLIPVFQIFSVYILFRGHNHPGGGFIGGLIGSIGFIFYVMTYGTKHTLKNYFRVHLKNDKVADLHSRARHRFHIARVNSRYRQRVEDEWKWEHRIMRIRPVYIIATGLFLAATSGLIGLFSGNPYMTAIWTGLEIPIVGKPGTTLLFDAGVYLLVFGIVLKITFVMAEE
ncbi:MnhB domain-containing protein [Pontibacter burrus]|uniref:Cation:proton antiporter n=1 Tax=Pontibacter burrus TaxID=2704466 RepID=A0A6B3LSG0_9BACT|nr:MnhB domain-containing protein [Pontibacter burrus]NEM98743.1 cation:proton antiporter [Pontibacter burrus]